VPRYTAYKTPGWKAVQRNHGHPNSGMRWRRNESTHIIPITSHSSTRVIHPIRHIQSVNIECCYCCYGDHSTVVAVFGHYQRQPTSLGRFRQRLSTAVIDLKSALMILLNLNLASSTLSGMFNQKARRQLWRSYCYIDCLGYYHIQLTSLGRFRQRASTPAIDLKAP